MEWLSGTCIHHHREVICELFRRKRKTRLQQDKLCTRDNHKNRRSIRNFNAQSFDNGLFWEEEINKNHFQFEQSATKDLIRGLKEVYASFQKESGLDKHVALKLLVQCLLIKYLENGTKIHRAGTLQVTYFQKHFQCNGFCDVIRQGKLLDLLDKLASDFNGKIFQWDKEKEVKERTSIRKTEIKYLANYLDANIENNQYVFWRLYSFSHLPVEVSVLYMKSY